jgi:hypothetical protein
MSDQNRMILCPYCSGEIRVQVAMTVTGAEKWADSQRDGADAWKDGLTAEQLATIEEARISGLLEAFGQAVTRRTDADAPRSIERFLITFFKTMRQSRVPQFVLQHYLPKAIPVDHPVFMIFGQPGIGKSSLGYSCKDALTLDFDRGAHRAANRRDTLVIDSWKDVEDLMASRTRWSPTRRSSVDTVGRCLDVLTAHLAKQDPKKFPGGVPGTAGLGRAEEHFRSWVRRCAGSARTCS